MLITKTVKLKWHSRNKEHLQSKGYVFTKMRDEVVIDVNDLMLGSKAEVEYLCDYCKKSVIRSTFNIYNNKRKIIRKDCCGKCQQTKTKECNLLRYGVESKSQLDEIKEKARETSIKHYGCDYPSQSEEIKKKIAKTTFERHGYKSALSSKRIRDKVKKDNLDKYGVEYFTQIDNVKEKTIKTNLRRFGVKYPTQNKEVRNKCKRTLFEHYGVEFPSQSPEIKQKINETLYSNGTCKTSKQQSEIFEWLKGEGYDVKINYPVSRLNLDIALFQDRNKVDIEYDAGYWHDKTRDRRRDEFAKKKGWKVLRIKSGHMLPDKKELTNKIEELLSGSRKYSEIVLEDWSDR